MDSKLVVKKEQEAYVVMLITEETREEVCDFIAMNCEDGTQDVYDAEDGMYVLFSVYWETYEIIPEERLRSMYVDIPDDHPLRNVVHPAIKLTAENYDEYAAKHRLAAREQLVDSYAIGVYGEETYAFYLLPLETFKDGKVTMGSVIPVTFVLKEDA